jgi:hypothetical protein
MGGETDTSELVEGQRLLDTFEVVATERVRSPTGRAVHRESLVRGRREQHLAWMGQRDDAGHPVDRWAGDRVVAHLHVTMIECETKARGRGQGGERGRRPDPDRHLGERHEDGRTAQTHDHGLGPLDGFRQHLVSPRQGSGASASAPRLGLELSHQDRSPLHARTRVHPQRDVLHQDPPFQLL